MNKVVLLGNLVKDPELKAIQSKSKYYTRVIIAINRNFKSSTGVKEADFIPVVFWGKNGRIGECGIYGKVFAFVEIDQTLRKEIKIFQSCFSPGILCVSVCSINSRIVSNLSLIIN